MLRCTNGYTPTQVLLLRGFRYSRDGCQLGDLLESVDGLSELRGMAIRENSFYLANSYKDER